jgi:integrase
MPPDRWVFSNRGGPLGYQHWAAAVRRAGRGIQGVSLHTLRHTLNTRLREAGIPDEILRGSFGWSAPDVQDGYTHRDRYDYSGQAAAIDSIFGGSHENY